MWESISSVSLIVAVLLGAIFFLLLTEKTIFSKAGLFFQSGIIIFFIGALFVYDYSSSHKVEINTYQYAQIYSLYTDADKDKFIKKEIYNALIDGKYTKHEYDRLKLNHLETMNHSDAMEQFSEVLPNVSLKYSNNIEKIAIGMSVATINMLRFAVMAFFVVLVVIYGFGFQNYYSARKLNLNDESTEKAINHWNLLRSKKMLIIFGIILTMNTSALAYNEFVLNDVTSSTKDLITQYGEDNKNIPVIYNAVQEVLADGHVTCDEFSHIANLENSVLITFIKKAILSSEYQDRPQKKPIVSIAVS